MAVEVREMATIALSDILDDLRAADQALRKFEYRYWMSSDVFYDLYSQGRLDDGENLEDFSEWAGFYKIKLHRASVLPHPTCRRWQCRSQSCHRKGYQYHSGRWRGHSPRLGGPFNFS